MSEINPIPNPQDPLDPMYVFVDEQPPSTYPNNPDSSPSHFTVRQFTPEAISNTFPIIVTKIAHGLLDGQTLRATKFVTMPVASATGMAQLNNQRFYVKVIDADAFYLVDKNGIAIDGSNYTPYIQGGEFTVIGQDLPIVNPSNFPPPGVVV